MHLQIISWVASDEGQEGRERYIINIFGRTDQGDALHVKVHYKPCFYLKCNQFPAIFSERFKHEKIKGRRSVWGYTPDTQTFYKVTFDSLRSRRYGEMTLKKMPIFEANIDPVLRFMHDKSIASTGWVEIPDGFVNGSELRAGYIKPIPRFDIAPIRIMSLDIECYSADGSFPDASKPDDCVFQIAMTTRTWGSDSIDECLLCMSEFKNEKALIEEFGRKMRQIDPDVVTGWNIFGFDLEYLYKRMNLAGCNPLAHHWGRDHDHPVTLVSKRLASNALGSNLLNMVPMFGRYVFDLFQEVKREQKFESYSLNNVSKVLLSDQKIDMPIKEMFKRFARWKESGDPEELKEIGDYCIKDTLLPHRIMDRLCTIPNLIEMAKATWVPLNYLSERGQQIKVFSQIAKKASELGFMIPTFYKKDSDVPDEKYKGATVLDADIGAYYDPVVALDFASLYPSIMMAHNLCYSTILLGGASHPDEETVGAARYVQNVPALLPEVLRELKQFRKQAKKDMALHKGTPLEDVYNAKQLAYKVSMNSVYGFTGASKGFLPLVDIASSVTAKGREMIQQTKDLVESEFEGAKVRYGDTDSVMVQFDVGNLKGDAAIRRSWELGEQASQRVQKILRSPNELELEKVYCPYFLYSKKRYAAKKWTLESDGSLESSVDVKGLQLVRRDICPFVRGVCKQVLDCILESQDPLPVIQFVRQAKEKLLSGEIPLSELTLTRNLAAEYKSQNLAHVKVRDKIREREPGSEPKSGDRIPFVLVKTDKKEKAAYQKAEDPSWVVDHGLELDYEYYFKNHMKKPVSDLLEPLIDQKDLWGT
jgi:DNA polymerase delta subunit 1